MNGHVLFTDDLEIECARILEMSHGYKRKFYVYSSPLADLDRIRNSLPGFGFIELKKALFPENSILFHGNSAQDFFVLKCLRFSRITDKNVELFQTGLKGYKLVIDEHPFMEKKDIYWGYFLWSYFGKGLMGYPHCYAFKNATEKKEIDFRDWSGRVSSATSSTIKEVFKGDVQIERIELGEQIHEEYQELKKELFEKETASTVIIGRLKRFLNSKEPRLSDGFNLLNLGKIYRQYKGGERSLVVSDAKVDKYLEGEFWTYVRAVNGFMSSIWDCTNNA